MKVLTILILTTLSFCLFPAIGLSDVIIHDMIVLKGQKIMLKVETKGKFFAKGGEIVEFFVNGKSIGKSLSGGDGFAFKQFTPLKAGMYQITAKSGKEEGKGLLLSLKKGNRIIFVDVEGSLLEGVFSKKPKKGSQGIIKRISSRFPVVFLQTELLGIKVIKKWLKENGFTELPVVPWKDGMIFGKRGKREEGEKGHIFI